VETFIKSVRTKQHNQTIKERVFALALELVKHGRQDHLIKRYQAIDKDFKETAKAAASETGKKKFGYMRSPELTTSGQLLVFYKGMLDCKGRKAGWSPGVISAASRLNTHLGQFESMTYNELRREVHKRRSELWQCQKDCADLRVKWLEEVAKDRARASGDDWKKKVQEMIRTTEAQTVNRKLTAILKGTHKRLDRIQVPVHDWFYSKEKDELYHYHNGVFEAHTAAKKSIFYSHHTLKVPPPVVELVVVKKSDDWLIIDKFLPTPATIWKDVTKQSDLEGLLVSRNKRHLQQTAYEEGISTEETLTTLRRQHGLSDDAEKVLNGEKYTDADVSPEMAAWFRAIRRPESDKGIAPVIGCMSTTEFQESFKKSTEKTSSSPSGIHYTLWKAMAADDEMAEWMAVMISLPFVYGFANNRWTREIDVMIEKEEGVRHIHKLRIIGLLEADFNTALKFFFAKQMMSNAEQLDLSDEQWGGRKNRSSIDAAMLKLLTFECGRTMKQTVAGCYYDLTACFDRMYPETSNLIAQRFKVDKNLLEARALVIARMRRHVKTGLGTSEVTYQQATDEHRVNGEIQGKGDVPSLWGIQSDTILRAHSDLCEGLDMEDCTGSRHIRMNNVAFVDDTDGWASAGLDEEDPVGRAIGILQRGAQVWNDLTNLTGGSIAFHKCKWQLLAWEAIRGELHLVTATNEEIVLKDSKGAISIIEFLSPDKPNKGLGYRLCPSGNQGPELEELVKKVTTVCNAVTSAHLSEKETRQALFQRLIPKISYPLHLTSFSRKECHSIDKIINKAFLPKSRLNRNTPRAIVHAPLRYGGMEVPDCYSLQNQLQIPYLMKQLRCNKTVANNFLVTLNNIQLVSGLTTPIFDQSEVHLTYMDKGWITELHSRMQEIEATMWIEDAWSPKLQRENDTAIMAAFSAVPWATKLQLKRANTVRMYMKVITTSDIADPTGTYIPDGRMIGTWIADSSLTWPNSVKPPKAWFALFRKLMRHSLAKDTPTHQPPHYSMSLDTELGDWFGVERHCKTQCATTKTELFWRDENTNDFDVFVKSNTANFYKFSHKVDSLPLWSHPVTFQRFERSIWTNRSFRCVTEATTQSLPPGLVHQDTLPRGINGKIIAVSDGSAHLRDKCAAGAWILATPEHEFISACFLMSDTSSLTSYRIELEGIFRALKHIEYLGLKPTEIEQWCDNKAAVIKTEKELSPKEMIAPEGDIILAIHALRAKLQVPITCNHVYGHQDGKNKAKSRNKPMKQEVQMNIGCDELANDTVEAIMEAAGQAPLQPILQPPYEGSKAMLRIAGEWITSNIPKHIQWSHRIQTAKAYCMKRHKWRENEFDDVSWDSIESVRRRLPMEHQVRTCKIMHGWLPVMHNLGKWTGVTQCPGCSEKDETFLHMLRCPNEGQHQQRGLLTSALADKWEKAHIPANVRVPILTIISRVLNNDDTSSVSEAYSDDVNQVIERQQRIGTSKLCQGFLTDGWLDLMPEAEVDKPAGKMITIQRDIWLDLITPLWKERNAILHKTKNPWNDASDEHLTTKLAWYKTHRYKLLDVYDQRLAAFDLTDMKHWSRKVKREWLRHLDIAKAAYMAECDGAAVGQTVLTRFFTLGDGEADESPSEKVPPVSFTHAGNNVIPTHATTVSHRVDSGHVPQSTTPKTGNSDDTPLGVPPVDLLVQLPATAPKGQSVLTHFFRQHPKQVAAQPEPTPTRSSAG
jgi:ribonuclease HI